MSCRGELKYPCNTECVITQAKRLGERFEPRPVFVLVTQVAGNLCQKLSSLQTGSFVNFKTN
jgi:hypothetical protein